MQDQLKYEIHEVISGKIKVWYTALFQTIVFTLKNGAPTSKEIENTGHCENSKKRDKKITFLRLPYSPELCSSSINSCLYY
jgi:hypothetical protein